MIGLDPFLCDFMTFDITGAISPFLVVPQRIILKLRADYSNFLPLLAVSYANFSQHFGECIVYKSQLFKKKTIDIHYENLHLANFIILFPSTIDRCTLSLSM